LYVLELNVASPRVVVGVWSRCHPARSGVPRILFLVTPTKLKDFHYTYLRLPTLSVKKLTSFYQSTIDQSSGR
jgi:hypothetical protein